MLALFHNYDPIHVPHTETDPAPIHQVKDVDVAMSKDSGLDGGIMRVDGGMTANSLLMQTQADFLGKQGAASGS